MNSNNYAAHRNTIKFGKPIIRKIIDVSQRVFRQDQIKRVQERNTR